MKRFGQVHSCIILRDNGRSRGFGFVTFMNHETAKHVAGLQHSIQGRTFGCNLIIPNKDAKNQLNDKKNRKLYIKVKDKHKLAKDKVFEVFSQFGDISEVTILKESKERSGFVLFEHKESVDMVLSQQVIPYFDSVIICEQCLSRKEIQKSKKVVGSPQSPVPPMTPGSPGLKGQSGSVANNRVDTRGSRTQREDPITPGIKIPLLKLESAEDPAFGSGPQLRPSDPIKQFQVLDPAPQSLQDRRYLSMSARDHYNPDKPKLIRPKITIGVNPAGNTEDIIVEEKPIEFQDAYLKPYEQKQTDLLCPSDQKAKDEHSMEGGFSRSPKNASQENGRNFLNIPLHAKDPYSKGLSDKGTTDKPKLLVRTGSMEETQRDLEVEWLLREPAVPAKDTPARSCKDIQLQKQSASKREMLGSRSVASAEVPEDEDEKYRINLPIEPRLNNRTKSFDEATQQTDKRRFSLQQDPNLGPLDCIDKALLVPPVQQNEARSTG